MNARASSIFVLLVSGVLFAAAVGCSLLPEAQSDPTKYYVLSTAANAGPAQAGAPTVHLREIDLASYLRGRPLVVRKGANEIEFREFARWGEPLELGLTRVIRDELLARGAVSAVRAAGARRDTANHDYSLNVRVLACEGAADGSVLFRAIWEISSTGDKPVVKARGEYRAQDLRWDGKSEALLAARLSEAASGLAGEIAAGLAK